MQIRDSNWMLVTRRKARPKPPGRSCFTCFISFFNIINRVLARQFGRVDLKIPILKHLETWKPTFILISAFENGELTSSCPNNSSSPCLLRYPRSPTIWSHTSLKQFKGYVTTDSAFLPRWSYHICCRYRHCHRLSEVRWGRVIMRHGRKSGFGSGCVYLVRKSSFNNENHAYGFSELAVVTLFGYNVLEAVYAIKYPRKPLPPLTSPTRIHTPKSSKATPKRPFKVLSPNVRDLLLILR